MVHKKVGGMLSDFIRGGARDREDMSEKTDPKDCVHHQPGKGLLQHLIAESTSKAL